MATPAAGEGLLGQLAVARGLVSHDQLRGCLELLGRDGNRDRLGEILLMKGLINSTQLAALLKELEGIQARLRASGPAAAPPPGAPVMDLELDLDLDGGTPVPAAKPSLPVRKSAAEVQREIDAQARVMEEKRKILEARSKKRKGGGRGPGPSSGERIELELEDDGQGDPFVLETSEGSREVSQEFPSATPPVPAAPLAPVRTPTQPTPAPVRTPSASKVVPLPVPTPVPAAAPAPPAPRPTGQGQKLLSDLVLAAARAFASDLHLHSGQPIMIRTQGRVVLSPSAPLVPESLEPALLDLLGPAERDVFATRGQVTISFGVADVARVRGTLVRTVRGPSAVFRLIPNSVPTLAALGLPTALARFVTVSQGLVLLAGPASSGKTWTLSALVDVVNAERREHILTVEDPIEFVHVPKRCVVMQREVPTHAADVPRAVQAGLHSDVDVLVIGEIKDAETARLALVAAESGKLVLATIAAPSCVRAISRLHGFFPADGAAIASAMIAASLRGVVCQRLIPTIDGARRLPVCEIVDGDAATAEAIGAGRIGDVVSALPFDQALAAAVRAGQVSREEARRHAERPEPFA